MSQRSAVQPSPERAVQGVLHWTALDSDGFSTDVSDS